MFRSSVFRDLALLLVVCALVFWWRLGRLGLIDPDEPFYAQTAREMVASGDWVTPRIFGAPQFEKPILFYWLASLSFRTLGENEFAARAPSALAATLLVLLVYVFGVRAVGRGAARLAALVLATGWEFAIMSRLMLTDIVLALFIAGAMFSYWRALEARENAGRWLLLHFACGGLAALTKGPLATVVTVLALALFTGLSRRPLAFRGPGLWLGLALYASIAAPWYAVMLHRFGFAYFDAFFVHENFMRLLHAEHPTNNHWYYYLGILLLGSIPWMPPLTAAAWQALRARSGEALDVFLWSWVLSSLAFLTVAQSKLPSYIFYLFAPLALLIGRTLDRWMESGFRSRAERGLVLGCAAVQCVLPLLAPFIKVARPFAGTALLVAACFGVGLVQLGRERWRSAILAQAAGTGALLIGALTFAFEAVEADSSARPVAAAMLDLHQGDEPLLAGKFLARGIHYYTGRSVMVLASKAQPFWTPHPLPVVAGREQLEALVGQRGGVCATIRRSEWPFWKKSPLVAGAGEPAWYGDNAVIRLSAPR